MNVYALPAAEAWICDQLADEWNTYSKMSTTNPGEADIIWLLSDWRWRHVSLGALRDPKKRVVTTVHHIVPAKWDTAAQIDFAERDVLTQAYHVYNQRTYDVVKTLTKKPIHLIPYWANQNIWRKTGNKSELRKKHGIPEDAYIIGSFQRDTEGHDLKSPKLEKGPDLLVDAIERIREKRHADKKSDVHVLLAGWRRQYVISRLQEAEIPFTYIERPPQPTLNELYQTLDLYPVTARHEGGPQALIECGLLGVPVVSRPVGIAEQVLPAGAIHEMVNFAEPAAPNVEHMKLPIGMNPYRTFFKSLPPKGQ